MSFEWLIIPASYLIGSLNGAHIICHLLGLPKPNNQGSGNPGATNVSRYAGKYIGAGVALFDILKAVLCIAIANIIDLPPPMALLCGMCAFIGHTYPIYHRFQGGKGVATYAGILLATKPLLLLTFVVCWLITTKISGFVSLGSMVAACIAAVLGFGLFQNGEQWILLCMAGLIIAKHGQHTTHASGQ